jgi:ribosome-associated protein
VSRGALEVTSTLSIPRKELSFRATRAGGPGGQHVNKSSTRVEIRWNVLTSRAITDTQRARLREKLGSRVSAYGTLRVAVGAHRSQLRNREVAETRLVKLLRRALSVSKRRRTATMDKRAAEKRLQAKHLLSEKKRRRREKDFD